MSRRLWSWIGAVVAATVVVSLVVGAAAAVVTVRRPFPQYEGQLRLPGLDGLVEVYRDGRGVPYVEASTTADLFFAQGFVTAQDRFFEMDLRRHIASGRLSELVGEDEAALDADRVIRALGWRRTAEAEARTLPDREREILEAYSAGVNAYLAGRSPSEVSLAYSLLELEVPVDPIEPWSPADSLSWLKAVAWDLSSNRELETRRALLLAEGIPPERVDQVLPAYPDAHPTIVEGLGDPVDVASSETSSVTSPETGPESGSETSPEAAGGAVQADLVAAADEVAAAVAALGAVPELLAGVTGEGSNSWVVAGEHTASGGALLANDPHLAPAVPSVWTQVGLRCRDVGPQCPFAVSGFTFAGLPGVVIGRNDRVAWGLTNMVVDDSDLYLEQVVDDRHYLWGDRRRPLEVRTETIRVAGGEDVELTVRSTHHGPLLSDVLDGVADVGRVAPVPDGSPERGEGYAVSLAWTGLEPARTFEALVSVNVAQDWPSFRSAAELLEVPAQNLVYADVDGRIGYQAPGRVPVRGAGDGLTPAIGWDPDHDWEGFVPFEGMPSVVDPPAGYLVTANNQVTRAEGAPYLGSEVASGHRAFAITRGLDRAVASGEVTVDDMATLQIDETSPLAEAIVPHLLAVSGLDDFTLEAVELLRDWDGQAAADSPAAAYAHAVWARLLELTFHDEMPEAARPTGNGRDVVAVQGLLADPEDPWWDDVRTQRVVEGRDRILAQALTDARLELTRVLAKDPDDWRWDRLHVLDVEQVPLGSPSVPWPVRRLVNLSPVGVGGSTEVVNAMSWDASSGSFEVTAVPSMRMVVDLAEPDGGAWVNTTGTSGHPAHPNYGDQRDAWADGRTYPWSVTEGAVREQSTDRLELLPPE